MISVVDTTNCHTLMNMYQPFLLILKRGELFHDAMAACMKKVQFGGASFTGIGALQDPVIAYFNLSQKQYEKKLYSGLYELISVHGTISYNSKNNIIVHAHAAIGNAEHQVIGGHLVSGMIGITGEITVTPFQGLISRQPVDFCGLELIHSE